MGATEKAAKFVVETSFSDLPENVVENAKIAIRDSLACMMASVNEPSIKILMEFVRENGGNPISTIIGADFKTNPPYAALINGTSSQSLDYDCSSMLGLHHGGTAAIVATLLALGEPNRISGKKLVAGFVIGMEIAGRIGGSLGWGHPVKGWHSGSTVGIFGGVAAASKILSLDIEGVKMALGHAASLASGSAANFGSMAKPFHIGVAAKNAVIAADLVNKGFTANKNVLEAPLGFYDLYRGGIEPDLEKLDLLGKPYIISFESEGGLQIKIYPCCHGIHPTIDNAFALATERQISAEDIDGITIHTHSGEIRAHLTKEYVDGGSVIHGYTGPRRQIVPSNPTTGAEGKFSLEYCVARALLDKEITFAKFTDEKVREPEVRELMKKVKILHDERMERLLEEGQRSGDGKMTGGLEIRLKDGREFYQEEDFPVGSFQHWPSKKVFEDKVRDCAAYGGFSQEIAEQVIRITENLEKLDDITELTEVLGRREK